MASKSVISVAVVRRCRPTTSVGGATHPSHEYLTTVNIYLDDGAEVTVDEFEKLFKTKCRKQLRNDPDLGLMDQADCEMRVLLRRPSDQEAWQRDATTEAMTEIFRTFKVTKSRVIDEEEMIKGSQLMIAVLTIITEAHSTGGSDRHSASLATIEEGETSQSRLRDAVVRAARKDKETPSAGAKLQQRIITQGSDKEVSGRRDRWYNSRPVTLRGPPIFIYEKAFSRFLSDMRNHKPSPTELDTVHDFLVKVLALYETEKLRMDDMKDYMSSLMGLNQIEQVFGYNVSFKPDGARTLAKGSHLPPFPGVYELQNEVGEGGSDPVAQTERVYTAVYSSDKALLVRQKSHCPAFLIAMAGPQISISGAIFTEGFISQPLTDYISLVPRLNSEGRSPLDDTTYRVAKLFYALRRGLDTLADDYSRLMDGLPRPQALTDTSIAGTSSSMRTTQPIAKYQEFIGPHFRHFWDPVTAGEVKLSYFKRYMDPFERALFLAEATFSNGESRKVIVKFAYRYNVAAHKLLADKGWAPTLWYSETREDVRNLCVLVMDHIPTSSRKQLSAIQITKLRDALQLLHEKGLVFGDLRWPNILRDDHDNLMLIDFDWCGNEGEAVYPSDILLELGTGKFHPTVEKGGVMRKEHDTFRFMAITDEDF